MAKEKKISKKGIATIAIVISVIALIYLLMAFYFKGHFMFMSTINGLKTGGLTSQDADIKIKKEVEDYLLTIYDCDGNKYHIAGADIGCKYIENNAVEELLKEQKSFAWPVTIFTDRKKTTKTSIDYDENLLKKQLLELECFNEENITKPVDAYINHNANGFYIESEVTGNKLNLENVLNKVENAIANMDTEITFSDDDYEKPVVYSDSDVLYKCLEEINKYTNVKITYDIKGYNEVVDQSVISSFITVSSDYKVDLNYDLVYNYVQGLAYKYNTYADVRNFKTTKGDTVQIGGGDYGWIVDKKGETEQLIADITAGESITREPVYTQRAFVKGVDDIGNTYIEIDYTNQHLWYYKDGVMTVETDIVTGNLSRGNGSPDGLFKIAYKKSPSTLVGETYATQVQYFMPFAYDVGIHDATWVARFGGDYYLTHGSHGCINVPTNIAASLYNVIEVGTPVIAFYRNPVTLTSESCKISNAYSYVENNSQ